MGVTETPNERFRRLAEARVNKVLNDLRLIGNLSNRNNYDFTADEIDKIFRAIDTELKQVKARFSDASKKDLEFRL